MLRKCKRKKFNVGGTDDATLKKVAHHVTQLWIIKRSMCPKLIFLRHSKWKLADDTYTLPYKCNYQHLHFVNIPTLQNEDVDSYIYARIQLSVFSPKTLWPWQASKYFISDCLLLSFLHIYDMNITIIVCPMISWYGRCYIDQTQQKQLKTDECALVPLYDAYWSEIWHLWNLTYLMDMHTHSCQVTLLYNSGWGSWYSVECNVALLGTI